MMLYDESTVPPPGTSVAGSQQTPSVNTTSHKSTSFLQVVVADTLNQPKPPSELKAKLKHWYLGAPGTLLGAALGLLVGYIVTTDAIQGPLKDYDFKYGKVAEKSVMQLGTLYLRAVLCVMVPLTVTNLTLVSAEIMTTKRWWCRIGWRAVAMSCFSSAIVVSLGLYVGIAFFSTYFEGRKFAFQPAPFVFYCPTNASHILQVNKKTGDLFCGPTTEATLQKVAFAVNDTAKKWSYSPNVNQFVDYGSVAREVQNVLFRITPTTFTKATNTNLVQLVVFGFVFGIAIGLVGKNPKTNKIMHVLRELNATFEIMTMWVMSVTPLALIPLVAGPIYAGTHNPFGGASKTFPQGNDIVHLIYYALAYLLVSAIHGLVVLPFLLLVFKCTNPIKLLWQMKEALIYAFGTSSSRQSLPVLRSNYDRAMGRAPQSMSRFLVHIGASLNKSGGALYIALSLVWLFYNAGLKDFFTPTKIVLAGIMSTLGSYAVAPVRNGGIAAVMCAFAMLTGLPTPYAFNFLLLVECLVDPLATVLNAWSNVVVTRIVEQTHDA
ncbi:Aste57867_1620 [Aphanomyces stellatus]|uniref:Amino acid transporter n=1 Tax=Aphanomyces stellatus TaxID=120398 RepID=A0A485K639_9STRA|nr:hypothetical protein As57867_001618 [Aphanomyces stellatus]VFT78833.1 Aste57867_1620 [Aphanomyces stellatus]